MCLSTIIRIPDDVADVPPGYGIHFPTLFGMGVVPTCILGMVCTAPAPCSRMCSSCLLLSLVMPLLLPYVGGALLLTLLVMRFVLPCDSDVLSMLYLLLRLVRFNTKCC